MSWVLSADTKALPEKFKQADTQYIEEKHGSQLEGPGFDTHLGQGLSVWSLLWVQWLRPAPQGWVKCREPVQYVVLTMLLSDLVKKMIFLNVRIFKGI